MPAGWTAWYANAVPGSARMAAQEGTQSGDAKPARRACCGVSQRLAVHHETGVVRDLVVQLHGRMICLMRLPVDPLQAVCLGPYIHGFDQRTADTFAALRLQRVEILQIAGRCDHGRVTVILDVLEPKQLAAELGDNSED